LGSLVGIGKYIGKRLDFFKDSKELGRNDKIEKKSSNPNLILHRNLDFESVVAVAVFVVVQDDDSYALCVARAGHYSELTFL